MDSLYFEYRDFFSNRIQHLEQSFKGEENSKSEETSSREKLETSVVARIRPLTEYERESNHVEGVLGHELGIINLYEPRRKAIRKPEINNSSFTLDEVYRPEISTQDIYNSRVKELVQWSLEGGTSMLLAYGQTGSGKTYTITGLESLLVDELIRGQASGKKEVKLSIFEVAGSHLFDLLSNREPLKAQEDVFGSVQIPSILETSPQTSDEFHRLLDTAKALRTSASTTKNDQSSRSHSICKITILDKKSLWLAPGSILLVDLAGSEASSDTSQHSKDRMTETREINKSLMILKECINKRAQWSVSKAEGSQKRVHIPFRNNKLTHVLKSAFDVDNTQTCKTIMMACIAPSILDVAQSKNTLRYAETLKMEVPKAKPLAFSEKIPSTWSNKDVHNWILKNSGTPVFNPQLLAPREDGTQMVRLNEDEFVRRCLLTENIDPERARLLYFKLWSLHIDSRALLNRTGGSVEKSEAVLKQKTNGNRKRVIKPGMFFRVKAADTEENLEVVMVMGLVANNDKGKWTCAAVYLTDASSGSHELFVAKQVVLTSAMLTEELPLVYDSTTRYYKVADAQ